MRVASRWECVTSPDQGEGEHEDFFKQFTPLYHRPLFSGALSHTGRATRQDTSSQEDFWRCQDGVQHNAGPGLQVSRLLLVQGTGRWDPMGQL